MTHPAGEFERQAASPIRRAIIFGVIATFVFFAGGFGYFVARLENQDPAHLPQGEAAVALTGGADRISDALELLAQGKVKRLLITGVNQATTGAEISRLTPRFNNWFKCCIDLGYEALNTRGNALETRSWVRQKQLRGPIVVVTSTYHMPRAMLELRYLMPQTTFAPYSVVTERQRKGEWWRSAKAARLLVFEYGKFLAAVVRTSMFPAPPG